MDSEVVYFELNNWFCGRDYPEGEPFQSWVNCSGYFLDENWCRNQKICVKIGYIDMSINFCVTATKEWVVTHCPKLLTDEEYTYCILTRSYEGDVKTNHTMKFSNFIRHPDADGEVYGRFGWIFLPYDEANFGHTWCNEYED